MSSDPRGLHLIERAHGHRDRVAVAAPEGTFTYGALLDASAAVARALLGDRSDLAEERVAFLVPPGFRYVALQWGIWRAGGIAVPLATSHPPRELAYVLDDADPVAAVVHPDFEERLAPAAAERGIPLLRTPGSSEDVLAEAPSPARSLPSLGPERRAMMLYTSGTTGRPKGVVTTHGNLEAQVTALVEAWGWRADDHILLVLPLHHVHGIVNVLTCALWSGARCQILPRFEPQETWARIERGDLTLFMAVPTVYAKLLGAWEAAPPERRARWTEGCRRMRLMVSGSAALPVSMLERWREVSGHTLLERYGMTEIGMALSNPLEGERRPGFVGRPLPGVEVRLVDDDGREVPAGAPGEIEVRGPAVFREYWRRPEETAASFRDGWFRTGDEAVVEEGYYRILGRRSVDIIKSGGYKVSALEVEEVLRAHPEVKECAVVSVPDEEWGERVAAALVPATGASEEAPGPRDVARPSSDPGAPGAPPPAPSADASRPPAPSPSTDPSRPSAPSPPAGARRPRAPSSGDPRPPALDGAAIRAWAKERLAPYKVPTVFLTVAELPRNAMGKVTKPAVQELFRRPDLPTDVL